MYVVRRATVLDAEAISTIHVNSWRSAYAGLLPDEVLENQSIERRLRFWAGELQAPGAPDNATWVIEDSGQVIGFASTGHCRDADRSKSADWELFAIYLDATQWGRRRGLALATEVLTAIPGGATTVSLWVLEGNSRAIRFYESIGFQADGQRRNELVGGVEITELRLMRNLPFGS